MDMAVVMKTEIEIYEHVLKFLVKEGFHPVALSDPGTGERFYPGTQTYVKVRPTIYIAVPRDERRGAQQHLKKWQAAKAQEDFKISAEVRKNAFRALILTLGVGLIWYVITKDAYSTVMGATTVGTIAFLAGIIKSNSPGNGKD